jgi:hypothetical protein
MDEKKKVYVYVSKKTKHTKMLRRAFILSSRAPRLIDLTPVLIPLNSDPLKFRPTAKILREPSSATAFEAVIELVILVFQNGDEVKRGPSHEETVRTRYFECTTQELLKCLADQVPKATNVKAVSNMAYLAGRYIVDRFSDRQIEPQYVENTCKFIAAAAERLKELGGGDDHDDDDDADYANYHLTEFMSRLFVPKLVESKGWFVSRCLCNEELRKVMIGKVRKGDKRFMKEFKKLVRESESEPKSNTKKKGK